MEDNFWSNRVKEFGHTGWADQTIYAFDQPNRIGITKYLVRKWGGGTHEALLDFGCGTGEFTESLHEEFNRCVMYDPCIDVLKKSKVDSKSVKKISDISRLKSDIGKFDVVISITVLQHILDDAELNEVLDVIKSKMKDDGIFIVMESFLDEEVSYIRHWNYSEFRQMFSKHGFVLKRGFDFYRDTIYEEKEFRRFKTIEIKILAWLYGRMPEYVKRVFFKIYQIKAGVVKSKKSGLQFLSKLTNGYGYKFFVFGLKECK